MGQSVALKLQSLLYVLYLEHIINTFGHFIGIRIGTCKKVKEDQARKRKKYDILFNAKYTKPPAHMHAISDSHCNVTCGARERQHSSCRVVLVLELYESVLE